MNQQEYSQAIEEMFIPTSKVLEWVQVVKDRYYDEFSELQRGYFERVLKSANKLVNLIPKIKILTDELDKHAAIVHGLAGPIVEIRDGAKIILTSFKIQPVTDEECEQYLLKISSTGQYLWILDRDILLKMHLDNLNNEQGK